MSTNMQAELLCVCGSTELTEIAVPPSMFSGVSTLYPTLKRGDSLLKCAACNICHPSGEWQANAEAMLARIKAMAQNSPAFGQVCRGLEFELLCNPLRRCAWDGGITAAQLKDEKCNICGRLVRDAPTDIVTVPASAVLVWFETLEIWQLVQV